MAQLGFYFDNARCSGCKTCQLACKDYKDLEAGLMLRRVYLFEGGDWTPREDGTWTTDAFAYHLSIACNHCDNPACFAACPTGAIAKDEATGLVLIDADACIGCDACITECPYDAPVRDDARDTVIKCDGCFDRVNAGENPICVDSCPVRALDFGAIADLRSRFGDVAQIPPLPAPTTSPNLVIKASPAVSSPAIASGFVANGKELA
ncbi:MAG: dimethylsulfoxide reductase subunit B [Eggerthellaceae bacterium]|nr:dimethylsulfoxide reductase subunit B [Eggerthellaceae bacterium]